MILKSTNVFYSNNQSISLVFLIVWTDKSIPSLYDETPDSLSLGSRVAVVSNFVGPHLPHFYSHHIRQTVRVDKASTQTLADLTRTKMHSKSWSPESLLSPMTINLLVAHMKQLISRALDNISVYFYSWKFNLSKFINCFDRTMKMKSIYSSFIYKLINAF